MEGCSHSGLRHNLHVLRLFFAKAQVISTKAKLDRIAQRSPADDFDASAVAKAHFQEASAELGIAAYREDAPTAANPEFVQGAGLRGAAVVTGRKATRLLHIRDS